MNLLYNLVAVQPIHHAKFHGGGSYGEVVFSALIRELYGKALASGDRLFAAFDSGKYLDAKIVSLCEKFGVPLFDIREKSPQRIIDENKIDTFYTPLYSLEKKWDVSVPRFVFTWHGVRALEMKYGLQGMKFARGLTQKAEALVRYRELWKKYFYKPKYENLARRILAGKVEAITVSEHSRASIRAFFPELFPVEIPVFYSPMDEVKPKGELPPGVVPRKYFLLTSGARWEKNNLSAVKALDVLMETFLSADPDFKVVVTGVPYSDIYRKNVKCVSRFLFLDYVETESLEFLHQNAFAFVFPSLNEGFGYPPMQSMRYGVPVAASGSTSIPEICGDAALYFDPHSESEMLNRFVQLLDGNIYGLYAERARVRYEEVRRRQEADLAKTVQYILGRRQEPFENPNKAIR